MINVYRETEVSLKNFSDILAMAPDAAPENPLPLAKLDSLAFDRVTFTHQTATKPALCDILP